jgi:transglutaminase-like putative cysteine protease
MRNRRRQLAKGPIEQLAGRAPLLGALLATTVSGLLFGPVYGGMLQPGVAVSVLAVVTLVFLSYELARRWPPVERWRPGLSLLLGLAAVVGTTLRHTTRHGVPTDSTIRALYDGARQSWQLTLQSTLPVRPEPQLVLFVPLLVLAAAVVSGQILLRTRARLVALLPSLGIAALAQAFHPLPPALAVAAALVYAIAAMLVLGTAAQSNGRIMAIASVVAVPVVIGCALAAAVLDPAGRTPYSLAAAVAPAPTPTAVTNPLDDLAYRLEHPQQRLFTVRGRPGVDRWPIAVLTTFDGTTWGSDARYRYLGDRLAPDRSLRVPTSSHIVTVTVNGLPGPWLPSQRGLQSVSGIQPLVDEDTGTLLYSRVTAGTRYRLRWAAPDVRPGQLVGARLATDLPGGMGRLDKIPPGIAALAQTAVAGAPPSLSTALVLERYLREHYRLAVGPNLPAGHGWPQIEHFLGVDGTAGRTGTSEQFAAAYVVMARALDMPARLVVGFRQPGTRRPDGSYVVRNADALAWPEVAVTGIGWIPLDPTGSEQDARAGQNAPPLASATNRARAHLPPPDRPRPKSPPSPTPRVSGTPDRPSSRLPTTNAVIALVAAAAIWLAGIPLVKELRGGSRRRRHGNAAVISAWLETRDRLRDHGIPIGRGMTVRDVALASRTLSSRATDQAINQLRVLVDAALWSGSAVGERGIYAAWQACDVVRRSLSHRPVRERITAAIRPRGLRRLK